MIVTVVGILFLVSTACGQYASPCYSCGQQTATVVGCTANCASPPMAKTVELKCEDGYVLQNGLCVQKFNIQCPPGSRYEGGRCVIIHTEPAICPVGSELRDGNCVKIFDQVCPLGYNMVNRQCIRSETVPISCPPGTYLQNNECIKTECPKNYRLENGWCVAMSEKTTTSCTTCPSGYVYQNNACYPSQPVINVPTQPVTPVCPHLPPPLPPTPPQPPTPTKIVECTSGYTLRNKECIREEIDCPEGTVLRGDKCERITCPPPSVWNGQYCVHYIVTGGGNNATNLVNNTHTVHNLNNVTHDTNVHVNNVNNVYIYKGGEVVKVTNGTTVLQPEVETIPSRPELRPEPSQPGPEPCCTVVTPRMCKQVNSRWRCFNRKYQRCGSFCTQPVIQLRPPQPMYRDRVLVMPPTPPMSPNCGTSGCSGQLNCSGCQSGGHCSPSCYQYSCGQDCEYQDQQTFCEENSGPGCGSQDGCYY